MLVLQKVIVLANIVILSVQSSRIYERCDLAKELLDKHELPRDQIATWVCIARHESEFNTSAYNPSSKDHGLFQISELFWCTTDGTNGGACGLSCSDLRNDDISDDVICAKRIYREHKGLSGDGFNAWVVYPLHCKNNVEKYTEDCFADKKNLQAVKSNYTTESYNNIGTTTRTKDNAINFRPKSRYFSNLDSTTTTTGPNRFFSTTTNLRDRKYNYISRSNIQYSKITTEKPTTNAQGRKYNVFSREIRKNHKFIEHPSGSRYKYHINKSGFSILKEN